MAKKSVKKETASKKSTPKKSPAKKSPTAKKTQTKKAVAKKTSTKQTKLQDNQKKGKLTVSQRERDEIDAVMDTLWAFVGALKNSWENARAILLAGIFIGLIGVTFSGYGQELVGVEQSGIWYAITENPDDLEASFDPVFNNRQYLEYSSGDEIRIEGKLTDIRYYGDIEDGLYPIPPSGLDPAVAPGDSFKILQPGTTDSLFPVLSENNSEMNINFASGLEFQRVHFNNTDLTAAVFTNVKFTDVLFSEYSFTDSFFIDCSFERVTFADVDFSKSVMSNVTFDAVLFNNVTMDSNRIEKSVLDTFLVRSSTFNSVTFDKTEIIGTKWSQSALNDGIFQRSSMDVVIFRDLEVNDFYLIDSKINYNFDVPLTSTFDHTFIELGEATVVVGGNVEDEYAAGAHLYFGNANVKLGGLAAGTAPTYGGWEPGSVTGQGFQKLNSGNLSVNLNYEYIYSDSKDIDITFWWNIAFDCIAVLGLGILIYAIGGPSAMLGLFKFLSPFIMTGAFFVVMFLSMGQREFLILSQLMLVYFVPPFGKGTVVPLGIAGGVDPWAIAICTAFVDIAVGVFLTWNFDLAKKIPFIGSGINRIQIKGKAMLKDLPWLERASFVGIVVFVMFPFQGSGAVGGTILGRAIGLSPNRNLSAVAIGAISGSLILSASVVYGLGVLAILAPLQIAVTVMFIGLCLVIYYLYQHWEEIKLEDVSQTIGGVSQTLGLHKEGLIGAPINASVGALGTAGGTVLKVTGDTSRTVLGAVGQTGKNITKTTGDFFGSLAGSFADDKSDYADTNKPTELDSGVLVSVAEQNVKRRVVVTGGAGFIGSHLVDRLVKRDEEVVVLDNFSSGEIEFLENSIENITLIDIDLLNEDFAGYLEGAKIVYHLAANPEVQLGITKPEVMQEQNVDVTKRVLEAMKLAGCENIVFTSTSTVYGDAEKIPTPETAELKPISAYGTSKLDAEKLIEKYCKENNFRGVSYRFANCVGPRSNHGVTFDFVNKLRKDNNNLEILGDGKQKKSYFHVEDCISGMLNMAPGELCEKGEMAALNVGSKDAIDVITLADQVCKAMKLDDVEYSFTGGVDGGRGWKGDVKFMRLDIKALMKHGWTPQYTSRRAIKETATWLHKNSE